MKRIISILMLAVLLCALAVPAAADTVAAPNNRFYQRHQKDCVNVNRTYYTNGPEGYVMARTTPGSRTGEPLPNGQPYGVQAIYQDRWGVVLFRIDAPNGGFETGEWEAVYGWVDLSEMVSEEEYASGGAALTPAADDATLRDAAKAAGSTSLYMIVCAVGVVIIAAAVLVAVIRRKRKQSEV